MSRNNNSQVSIGPKEIGAISEEGEEPDEYLGYLLFSTTGEVEVPRDWLMDQFSEHELPAKYLPRDPTNWQAYRRAKNALLDDADAKFFKVYQEEYDHTFNCKWDMEKSNEMGSNVYIIYAKVFWPEEIIGEEGGDWKSTRVGYIDFDDPEGGVGGPIAEPEVDKDNVFFKNFMSLKGRLQGLFTHYQDRHNFNDLQDILEDFRADANAVPIRRAVYFIGAHHEDRMEALSQIWQGMNAFKEGGEEMRIESTPVLNMESQREMVANRARDMVEEMVDDIITETIQEWEETEEQTADEAAREIVNQLSDSEQVASEYNQLLSMRLSVKEVLQERMDDFAEDQEDIIENVLNQKDFSDFGGN